ncbi:MAG TPA: LysM peptidoglycan-binding domain-containing M23 family metallopeptidase [Stellaceae bacterium]|nr:LysM peptidoglycan-binding domain-containing M23 family metallopeptidase [Stellaceae bacterium]
MRRCTVLFILALGLLAGCGRTVGPAPYELHTHPGPPTLSEPLGPHPDRVKVAEGDTLYGVSRRYGVPMRAIIDANRLAPPYRLVTGATLALPQVRTHLVRAGDTLATVARQYGVDTSTLAATNHLAPPYVIRTGETLVLPAPVETARAARAPAPVPVPPPAPLASNAAPPPAAMPAPLAALDGPPPPAAPSAPPAAEPSAPRQTASLPPPVPVPVAGKGFLWPVRGRVVSSYGTAPEGTHNDGINIAATEGTPVIAADAGEVAYAGNELKGYGNLILVKHANGFITAYAHNQTLLVKRGDKVARGQAIARVGATGAVAEPQLHFEIRRGARALDPMEYLPAQAAAAPS